MHISKLTSGKRHFNCVNLLNKKWLQIIKIVMFILEQYPYFFKGSILKKIIKNWSKWICIV